MSSGKGLTKNQRAVFAVLQGAQTPMGAYQILDQVRDQGLRAPLQIYRALESLAQKGLVHRIESLNAFVACSHAPHPEPAAFIICEKCGRAAEITLDECDLHLTRAAGDHGFEVASVRVEMFGRCAACAEAV
ncbi:MAG: zinc uptake transcriptional repressor Zur [Methyloligellaceae bacterium]